MKKIEEYTVQEMLTMMEASDAASILELGITRGVEAAIYPAMADLLERERYDIVKDVLYKMLAESVLKVDTTGLDELLEFIMDSCGDKHDELCEICEDLHNSETLGDFMEKRRLFRGRSADTGETTLVEC